MSEDEDEDEDNNINDDNNKNKIIDKLKKKKMCYYQHTSRISSLLYVKIFVNSKIFRHLTFLYHTTLPCNALQCTAVMNYTVPVLPYQTCHKGERVHNI